MINKLELTNHDKYGGHTNKIRIVVSPMQCSICSNFYLCYSNQNLLNLVMLLLELIISEQL